MPVKWYFSHLEVACSIHARGTYISYEAIQMGDILYDIEIGQSPTSYTAKLKSYVKTQKPLKEYKGATFEEILEQIVRDIMDENEDWPYLIKDKSDRQ